jgi:hypothetical protein
MRPTTGVAAKAVPTAALSRERIKSCFFMVVSQFKKTLNIQQGKHKKWGKVKNIMGA